MDSIAFLLLIILLSNTYPQWTLKQSNQSYNQPTELYYNTSTLI